MNSNTDTLSAAADALEALRDDVYTDIDALDTTGIVDVYHESNRISKVVDKTLKETRSILLDRLADGTEDEKGTVHFKTASTHIEARPRIKTTFRPERAEELLKDKGLYGLATDTTTVVRDPEALHDALAKAQERLIQLGESALAAELETVLKMATEERVAINETKIETLHKKGKLSAAEVESFFDINKSFALYDVTP